LAAGESESSLLARVDFMVVNPVYKYINESFRESHGEEKSKDEDNTGAL